VTLGELFLSAFGLFLALEGLAYAGAPQMMKQVARRISDMSAGDLQRAGLIAAALGAGVIYIVARLR
jgi:uncharacterized protein YjeT (DUF2065 family)